MKRLTLNEARLVLAKNMVEREKVRQVAHVPTRAFDDPEPDPVEVPRAQKRLKALESERKSFLNQMASDPTLRPHMWCWMVDISGKQEPAWVAEGRNPQGQEFEDSVKAKNLLSSDVRKVIEDAGFRITDSGSGCGGWDLGVPCNDEESRRLCDLLHTKFRDHIDADLLEVHLKFWGWHINGIRNVTDAEKLLEN